MLQMTKGKAFQMRLHGTYGAALLAFQVLVGVFLSGCDAPAPDVKQAASTTQTGCGEANSVKQAAATRQIVAFGDSLYAGYRLGPCDGFAPQLQAALRAKGLGVSLLNAGVSGDTTAAGLARLSFVLDNTPQKPDMVILGLGGNDMLRGIKPAETRTNLTAMLDELKRRNIEVILTGMLASPNMGPDYGKQFNAIYPDLAKKYGAPLYPFFLDGVVTDKTKMLPDGIHPNKDGVARIVTGIEPVVAGALQAGN
jgi:acyl-CoA thioesterase I